MRRIIKMITVVSCWVLFIIFLPFLVAFLLLFFWLGTSDIVKRAQDDLLAMSVAMIDL